MECLLKVEVALLLHFREVAEIDGRLGWEVGFATHQDLLEFDPVHPCRDTVGSVPEGLARSR